MRLGLRAAAVSLAFLLFALVALLRLGAAEGSDLGPEALDRFAAQPYGFDIPRTTHPFFLTWSLGDGQAFMSVAADLNGDSISTGLGYQSYRMGRIGLSVAARLLAIGDVGKLPYGLAAASFLSYGGLLVLAVRLTDRLGLRAMLLGASPAAVIGTIFDSAEGLGSTLLVLGLTASSMVVAVVGSALLGLTRPTYATALLPSRSGLWPATAALAAGGSLQILLVQWFGIPFSASSESIVPPFTGVLRAIPQMTLASGLSSLAVMMMAMILFAHAVSAAYLPWYRVSALVSALLAVSLGPNIFEAGPLSPLRVSGALLVLIVLSPMFDLAGVDQRLRRSAQTAQPLEGRTR